MKNNKLTIGMVFCIIVTIFNLNLLAQEFRTSITKRVDGNIYLNWPVDNAGEYEYGVYELVGTNRTLIRTGLPPIAVPRTGMMKMYQIGKTPFIGLPSFTGETGWKFYLEVFPIFKKGTYTVSVTNNLGNWNRTFTGSFTNGFVVSDELASFEGYEGNGLEFTILVSSNASIRQIKRVAEIHKPNGGKGWPEQYYGALVVEDESIVSTETNGYRHNFDSAIADILAEMRAFPMKSFNVQSNAWVYPNVSSWSHAKDSNDWQKIANVLNGVYGQVPSHVYIWMTNVGNIDVTITNRPTFLLIDGCNNPTNLIRSIYGDIGRIHRNRAEMQFKGFYPHCIVYFDGEQYSDYREDISEIHSVWLRRFISKAFYKEVDAILPRYTISRALQYASVMEDDITHNPTADCVRVVGCSEIGVDEIFFSPDPPEM